MTKTESNAQPGNRHEAQKLVHLAQSAKKRSDSLALARQALALDGECTDAQVLLAREDTASPRELASRLKLVVDRAEAKLGAPFLRDNWPRLWDHAEARPYLRARFALAEALEKAGKPAQAIPHLSELKRVGERDPLGARFRLVSCLAATDLKSLAKLLSTWEENDPTFVAWACVLERVRSKADKAAEKALALARETNPFVEEFLTGKRKLPKQTPADPQPGTVEDAAVTLQRFGDAWMNDREALYWLFRHR